MPACLPRLLALLTRTHAHRHRQSVLAAADVRGTRARAPSLAHSLLSSNGACRLARRRTGASAAAPAFPSLSLSLASGQESSSVGSKEGGTTPARSRVLTLRSSSPAAACDGKSQEAAAAAGLTRSLRLPTCSLARSLVRPCPSPSSLSHSHPSLSKKKERVCVCE